MARNAKVYGKQRTNELVSAFQSLDLTPPQKGDDSGSQSKVNSRQHSASGPDVVIKQLHALAPVIGNKRRARRVENDYLKDGPAVVENAPQRKISQRYYRLNAKGLDFLLVDKIPSPQRLEMPARSAGRIKEPNTEPKLTRRPRLPRALVSTAKGEQLYSLINSKQKLMLE